MKTKTKMLITEFGQDITIKKSENDNLIYTKAFIQPLRCDYQSEMYGDYLDNPGDEQYLYIGLSEYPISTYPNTTVITSNNQNYTIKKAETVYLSNTPMYERAVLEKEIS